MSSSSNRQRRRDYVQHLAEELIENDPESRIIAAMYIELVFRTALYIADAEGHARVGRRDVQAAARVVEEVLAELNEDAVDAAGAPENNNDAK